jgi:hypothetical protein
MKIIFFTACLIIGFSLPASAAKYTSMQLESLAAPIALYPDTLLKDMLPAATFPDQITDAALLIQDKSDADLIKSQSWDKSVKVIANYPGVLKMMYGKLIWTTQLGEAFLNQSDELLSAIQTLRAKADKIGNLKSDGKQEVTKEKTSSGTTVIKIEPSDPQVIYVPENTTTVIYTEPAQPNYVAPLVTLGLGVAIGAALADDDDDHYYYGGGGMWGAGSYDSWADTRRARNEDLHDARMDRMDSRQGRMDSRQDFRQDNAGNYRGSVNQDSLNKAKANRSANTDSRSAKLDSARANMNNRSASSARTNSSRSTAFSGTSSGSYSSRASSRGASSRSGSYGSGGYGGSRPSSSSFGSRSGGGSFSGGSRGGGFSRGGGGGGRRR